MLTRKFLLLAVAVFASSILFAAAQVSAQPTQCTGGQYTVQIKSTPDFPFPFLDEAGNKVWKYTIQASQTALNSVKDFVAVVHRPVTPQDIFPFPTLRTYCDQSDTNTKINRGNCDGFPVSIPLIKVGNVLEATIITSPRVTKGLITANIVSGSATADTCIAIEENFRTGGILGPAELGDPFQPVYEDQFVSVAGGKCVAHLEFDDQGKLIEVTTTTPGCFTGSPPNGKLFVGNEEIRNNTGPHGITFGNNTTTCYGPSIPSPARCICTKSPCP